MEGAWLRTPWEGGGYKNCSNDFYLPSRRLEGGGGQHPVPVEATHHTKETELYSGRDEATRLGLSPLIGDPIFSVQCTLFLYPWAGWGE